MRVIPGIAGTGGRLWELPGGAETPGWGRKYPKIPQNTFLRIIPLAELFITLMTWTVLFGTCCPTGASCKPAGNLGNFWRTNMAKAGFLVGLFGFFFNHYYYYLIVHLLWY